MPADPRPRSRRATVRVLLVDDTDRLLLLHDSDLGTGATWWMTPGGGIDPGEDIAATAVRELAEETGLRIGRDEVQGPLATVRVVHGYSDKVVDQHDSYVLVRTTAFAIDTSGFTADEQATVLGHRWWTREEVLATDATVWPARLPQLWELAARPSDWPQTLPDVEESSVAVGPSTAQPRSSPG